MITATKTVAPTAARLARLANALADQHARGMFPTGQESLCALVADWDMVTWVARAGYIVLQLCPVNFDGTSGDAVRTVTVCPGEYRTFEIIEGDRLVVGEARGAAAAFGIALDRLVAPIMGAHQHAHDAVSV